MKRFIFVVSGVLLLAQVVQAQDNWTLSGQLRYRTHMENKDFSSTTRYNSYSLLRSRLNLSFKQSESVSAFFQVQDSRTFGEEGNTLSDGSADNLDFHQAYVKVNNLFNKNIDMKIGRMEAAYGNQRIIGSVGWHNIARSFDGVVFTFKTEAGSMDVFNYKESEGKQAGDLGDLNFFGVVGNYKVGEHYTIMPYYLSQRKRPVDELNRSTFGGFVDSKFDRFYHKTEAALQVGEKSGMTVSAYMLSFLGGIKLDGISVKPDFAAGVDYLSGNDASQATKIKAFDTMYATNHKFYGFMDHFINIPVHTSGLGLVDYQVKFGFEGNEKTTISSTFHHFRAASDYTLVDGSESDLFGNELDILVSHAYGDNISFVGGFFFTKPGDIFKELKGPDGSSMFFLQMVVNMK